MGGSTAGGVRRSPQVEQEVQATDIMFSEQLEFTTVDPALISIQPSEEPDIKKYVWQRILPLLKTTLLFNPE